MLTDDIEQILNDHADEELLVGLSSGESVVIHRPDQVRISGMKMWVFTGLQPGRFVTTGPVRYISVVNIATITPVKSTQPPGAN